MMTTALSPLSGNTDRSKTAYCLPAGALARDLDVGTDNGLSADEVARRTAQFGANRLPDAPRRSPWLVFASQFKSILILILIGAAILAALVGDVKDAVVILAVVVINAIVGFVQEYRAERSVAALKGMLPLNARVRRDGRKLEVPADALVPGDVLLLEAGDQTPADARLFVAAGLEVDESALTGESQPVSKQVAELTTADVPLAEQFNMVFMNTLVTRGRAEAIVTATGARTEMGRLSLALASTPEAPTPLQVQLDQLGKRLGAIALTLVGLLSFLELLRGTKLALIALDAIALAVAGVPEGLPVVVTVTLALGMRTMARHRAIVKRLASVETLGCTTVICTDKTGTLTLNQMTARAFFYRGQRFEVTGDGYDPTGQVFATDGATPPADLTALLLPIVACNDSRVTEGRVIGDPTEGALLILSQKASSSTGRHVAVPPRIAEIPFDAAHKFMATFHRDRDVVHVFVKGAPDVVLARCARMLTSQGERPLDDAARAEVDEEYALLADRGLRGLLVATRTIDATSFGQAPDLFGWARELTCVGVVGLMDPPRPEAKAAIAKCKHAGIAVKMITGDHPRTASAIARELGLEGATMTGAEIDRMDSDALGEVIDDITVFARVSPANKVTIVRALQRNGHVVAMTGDGVNDSPALKGADIGVAMGSGTAVAREAATMVLTDDNFATLVSAVRQGRTLYDNIVKFVHFQLSATMGAILTVFFAPLAGLPEPLSAVQILWVAIIMDGPPAVSLALDSARPGIMSEAPRGRSEPVLPFARISKVVSHGLTMMIATLAVLYYGLQAGMGQRAFTLAFTTFVLAQIFDVFNARFEHGTAFNRHLFTNRMLWASLGGVVVLQIVAVHWSPAQQVFTTADLTMTEWGIAIMAASSVLLLEEGRKLGLFLFDRVRAPHRLARA